MMNYFLAKGVIRNYEDVTNIIEAFFKNFNPQNTLLIKDDKVEMTVFFEEPPMEALKAISYCKFVEFRYGEKLNEAENEEKHEIQVEEGNETSTSLASCKEENEENSFEGHIGADSIQTVTEIVGQKSELEHEEIPNESRPSKKDRKGVKTGTLHGTPNMSRILRAAHSNEIPKIVKLDEIAEKSTSYEDFVNHVATWLELKGTRYTFFVDSCLAALKAEKIAWPQIETVLTSMGSGAMSSISYNKTGCNKQIAEKLKYSETPITILVLLKAIVRYKTFEFKKENEEEIVTNAADACENASQIEGNSEIKDEAKINEDTKSEDNQSKSLMPCMPFIPEFEQALKTVDKTKPIEERVKHVLPAMGWQDVSENKVYQTIFDITVKRLKIKDYHPIMKCRDIKSLDDLNYEDRMEFSRFINNYVMKYYPDERVSLLGFLEDLKKVLLLESELKS